MLVSAIQLSESAWCIHTSPLFWPACPSPTPSHPSRSSQSTQLSSLRLAALALCFAHGRAHTSVPISQFIPPASCLVHTPFSCVGVSSVPPSSFLTVLICPVFFSTSPSLEHCLCPPHCDRPPPRARSSVTLLVGANLYDCLQPPTSTLLLKRTSHLLPYRDPHLGGLILFLILEDQPSSGEKMLQARLLIEGTGNNFPSGSYCCTGGFGLCLRQLQFSSVQSLSCV